VAQTQFFVLAGKVGESLPTSEFDRKAHLINSVLVNVNHASQKPGYTKLEALFGAHRGLQAERGSRLLTDPGLQRQCAAVCCHLPVGLR
jgi:hypothetical protein